MQLPSGNFNYTEKSEKQTASHQLEYIFRNRQTGWSEDEEGILLLMSIRSWLTKKTKHGANQHHIHENEFLGIEPWSQQSIRKVMKGKDKYLAFYVKLFWNRRHGHMGGR